MAMKIVILEDNAERREEMNVFLRDRFYTFESVFFTNPQDCNTYLEKHLFETILICLDHDIELIDQGNGNLIDPGTGRDVAEMLAKRKPNCPILFHSTNSHAVHAMKDLLEESGWSTYSVSPWGGVEWIKASWYPTVRKLLLRSAKEQGKANDLANAIPVSPTAFPQEKKFS